MFYEVVIEKIKKTLKNVASSNTAEPHYNGPYYNGRRL
jgi:hypothetical protein